jgi:hypothetical protein
VSTVVPVVEVKYIFSFSKYNFMKKKTVGVKKNKACHICCPSGK